MSDTYTFRMKGIVSKYSRDQATGMMDKNTEKKVYLFETTSFQKAVIRAKKVFQHIHSVEQIHGEILDQ